MLQSCANPFFRPVASDGKFRDKMKPSLQNASFRPPFAGARLYLLGIERNAWTTPFLVPLTGQNKNSRRASPTFPYGSFYCLRMIELWNHLAKRRVQGRKRLFLVALCSAPSGIAGYYRPDAGAVILTFLGGCCYSRRGLPANEI